MGWQDLIAKPDESVTVPWTGGREIRAQRRVLQVEGRLPKEHGWHEFNITGGRKASWKGLVEPNIDEVFAGAKFSKGYLVGDRFIPDGVAAAVEPTKIIEQTEPVHLVELGLERFARVKVARWEDGRLIYVGQEFPLGPEGEVTNAYQDRKPSVSDITNVTPALDLAFRFESWNRSEGERLRAEAERLAREEEAKKAAEIRRAELARQLGTGDGRREMAKLDFGAAAKAALAVGGAELLDWRDSRVAGEAVVQFRYSGRRFECVAQKETLRIIDSGICLVDHGSGERGDTRFTLESLPGVIGQAQRERRLVVFRHVDERGGYVRNDDGDFQDEDEDY